MITIYEIKFTELFLLRFEKMQQKEINNLDLTFGE